jgi:hypothetical protein
MWMSAAMVVIILALMMAWLIGGGVFLFGTGKQFQFESRFMWLALSTLQFGMVLSFATGLGGVLVVYRSFSTVDRVVAITNGLLGALMACAGLGVASVCLGYTSQSIEAVHLSLSLTERWTTPIGVTGGLHESELAPYGEAPGDVAPAPPAP